MTALGWMSRVEMCVLVLGACGYPPLERIASDASLEGIADAGSGSDINQIPLDGPPICYGTGIVKVCLVAAPSDALNVNADLIIDTDSMMCANNVVSGGDGYCVIAKTDITVSANIRATGSKPLVLIARGSITGTNPDAVIDAGSNRTSPKERGAGSDSAACKPPKSAPNNKGGGAAGSFIGKGGDGGDGANAANSGGTAGDLVAANTVTSLRGGCDGQDGDNDTASLGHGGGAILLIANTKIDFAGSIRAGGESGLGAAAGKGGGGGAGSGGMIGFDAPMITVTSGVYANGGGGGGGEGVSSGNTAGGNGDDASNKDMAVGGSGGSNTGGDGGFGSSTANVGGQTGSAGVTFMAGNGGGGGGGGGAGIIKAPAGANFNSKVYPPPTP